MVLFKIQYCELQIQSWQIFKNHLCSLFLFENNLGQLQSYVVKSFLCFGCFLILLISLSGTLILFKNHIITKQQIKNMEKPVSSNSFFFILQPNYFKIQHGFAKNMKSGTTYRLSLYKGIQSQDEMKEPIKAKLVGGKILFNETILNFSLPFYTPTKNIQFTVKVLQTKPNEQQKEIASIKIKSGDFIQAYRNTKSSIHPVQSILLQNFAIAFTLFIHNSKLELDKLYQDHEKQARKESRNNVVNNKGTVPKKNGYGSEVYSESEKEETNRVGANYSSKKRIIRKRGHDGKLKSRGSRDGSVSSRSSQVSKGGRKSFAKYPHGQQNQHFIRSPKNSPPKQQDKKEDEAIPQVVSGKKLNYVTVTRKDSGNILKSGPGSPKIPTKLQKANQKNSNDNQRSQILPISSPSSKLPVVTRNAKDSSTNKDLHNLQFVGSNKIFDLKNKASPKNRDIKETKETKEVQEVREHKESKDGNEEVKQIELKQTDSVVVPHKDMASPGLTPGPSDIEVQSVSNIEYNIKIRDEKFVSKQQSHISLEQSPQSPKSPFTPISPQYAQLKQKGKKVSQSQSLSVGHLPSLNLKNNRSLNSETEDVFSEQKAKRVYQNAKSKFFYVLFFIISAFLLWNAITPRSKV